MSMTRRIAAIVALPGHRLRVTWKDGAVDTIDMTGVLSSAAIFAPLRRADAFADVRVVAYGAGIEWGDGHLDQSADSLEEIASQQRMAMAG